MTLLGPTSRWISANAPKLRKIVETITGITFHCPGPIHPFFAPWKYIDAAGKSQRVWSHSLLGHGAMNLDVNTLFLVTIYVEAILGLLLLFAWIQNPQIRAVAWCGCAHLLRASSVVLFGMYGTVS